MSIRWTLNPTAFQDTSSPNVEALASEPRQPAKSYGSYGSYGHTVIRRLGAAPSCPVSEPACRARATRGRNSSQEKNSSPLLGTVARFYLTHETMHAMHSFCIGYRYHDLDHELKDIFSFPSLHDLDHEVNDIFPHFMSW